MFELTKIKSVDQYPKDVAKPNRHYQEENHDERETVGEAEDLKIHNNNYGGEYGFSHGKHVEDFASLSWEFPLEDLVPILLIEAYAKI